MIDSKVVILHNIISPYKTLLFNELSGIFPNLTVLYIAETEGRRDWKIVHSELHFRYEVMFDALCDEVGKGALFRKTFARLCELKPEILIVDGYQYASAWAGLLWAKLNRRKVVLWTSSTAADLPRYRLREAAKSAFIRCFDAYNSYSTRSSGYLVQLGVKREAITLTGNNTDNNFYHRETKRWRKEKERLCREAGQPRHNFLFIGRLSEEKNIFRLLEAYGEVTRQCSDWGLILLGSGPQREEIVRYIETHRLPNILMPGYKQREEVPKYLAMSDVFVLPSLSEPWGLVANEAMAAELPVVVSNRCGCYPDLVHDAENGFSFDPTSVGTLTKLLLDFGKGRVDLARMGQNALETVQAFSPRRAAEAVTRTVLSVAAPGGHGELVGSKEGA